MRVELDGINAEIMELIRDLENASEIMADKSAEAAEQSADIILAEQKRIFSKAHFKRDKKNHTYKMASSALLQKVKSKTGTYRVKFACGFSTETLQQYPELLMIEFGRPGISPKHSGKTMEVRRKGRIYTIKKGSFPAQTMPVRAGFNAAKEKALRHYSDVMLEKVQNIFNGR